MTGESVVKRTQDTSIFKDFYWIPTVLWSKIEISYQRSESEAVGRRSAVVS